jgi:Fic family protein
MPSSSRTIGDLRFRESIEALRALAPHAALARETKRLWRAEIVGSALLAGTRLDPADIDALLDRGVALGGRPLDDYLLIRAYADAARWVAEQRALGQPPIRPLVSVDEIRQLHARIIAPDLAGGAWRLSNPHPLDRIVPPPPWLVPREVEAFADRVGRGPGTESLPLWLARMLGRFARIRPFERGNDRVLRLVANLVLRRLDIPPAVFERPERARYRAAVASAESGEPTPLAMLVTSAVVRSCDRLMAVADADPLEALPLLAGTDYAALAKAAQRGRLRTVLRGGRYFTTRGWIAAYRSRSAR